MSLVWLIGGMTLVVFSEACATVVLYRRAWPVARFGYVRRTFIVAGVGLVLIGLLFLAGCGLPGSAANSLVLVWLLARLGRVRR